MKTVAVFFGGKSTEHDVSIITALSSVVKPLEATKQYLVLPVYIAKDGAFYSDSRLKDITLYTSGKIDAVLGHLQPATFQIDGHKLALIQKGRLSTQKKLYVDVAFPATHGTYGEDGSLMGLLRMAGIPFVGCDMEASVIAMNKLLAHQVVKDAGLPSHAYVSATKQQYTTNKNAVLTLVAKLTYPLFVKPVHLGSSIGITRVADESSLEEALNVAFSYDAVVIIEEAVPNLIEVTVPVMGTTAEPQVGLVEKPLFDTDKAFDFDTKYMQQGKGKGKASGKTTGAQGYSELPAKLPKDLYARCEDIAKMVYATTGCYGIARVDLLINGKTNEVFFNEINPLPGSLYMHNWQAAGKSAVEVVSELINLAQSRADNEKSVATSFETNFLKQF